jgi:O-acetyl-ADP-ribose deacetylase (regulator of RNase III)
LTARRAGPVCDFFARRFHGADLLSLNLIFCETHDEMLAAWRRYFGERPEVEVREAAVLNVAADAVLLPGNSFGFLSGGLELEATEVFGFELQDAIRDDIVTEHHGELLVGQAVHHSVTRTGTTTAGGTAAGSQPQPGTKQELIYAPIWRVPQDVDRTVNAYLALRAALLCILQTPLAERIHTLAVPALGVSPGGMAPLICARQMRQACRLLKGKSGAGKNLSQIQRRDRKLRSMPQVGEDPKEE